MAFSMRGRSEINVTPLIDVLLVLLVIFMIVIPKVVQVEEVTVPPRAGSDVEPLPALVLTVKADLSATLTDDDVDIALAPSELSSGLRGHLRDNTHVVFVEFEDAVLWDQVVATIDTIRGVAPMTQVALKVRD